MTARDFKELRVYQLAESLSDEVWKIVRGWDHFARDTLGKQLVRSVDSIGANLAEGTGRGTFQDNKRFVAIARGSLYETRHWLRRAHQRNLLTREQSMRLQGWIGDLGPRLNAYHRSIGRQPHSPPPLPAISNQQSVSSNQQPVTSDQ